MSRAILIYGESGSGKTTSLRTLNPERTFIVDADRKGLSWRGWKKQYNGEKKNYVQSSKVSVVESIYQKMQGEWADRFDNLVIDGLTTIMVDDEMARAKERGFDKFVDLAQCVWNIVSDAHLLRDNLNVIFIAHSTTERDENHVWTHVKTGGRKLDKIVLESKFTTVLWAKCIDGKYIFATQADHSTAKSPMGCFTEKEIQNDMQAVINALEAYENEEEK